MILAGWPWLRRVRSHRTTRKSWCWLGTLHRRGSATLREAPAGVEVSSERRASAMLPWRKVFSGAAGRDVPPQRTSRRSGMTVVVRDEPATEALTHPEEIRSDFDLHVGSFIHLQGSAR